MLSYIDKYTADISKYDERVLAPLMQIRPDSIANIGISTDISFEKELISAINTMKSKLSFIEHRDTTRDLLLDSFYRHMQSDEVSVLNGNYSCTQLENHSVDILTIAEANENIDINSFHTEANRVLKRDGIVYMVWNRFNEEAPAFNLLTNLILEYYPKYTGLNSGIQFWCKNKSKLFGSYTISKYSNTLFITPQQLASSVVASLNEDVSDEFMGKLTNITHQLCNRGEICIPNELVILYGAPLQSSEIIS